MFTRTPKSPTTAKPSRRSTNPKAVNLRRLQNRIAQRKHRRRVRESNQARQATDGTSILEETYDENQRAGNNKSFDAQCLPQQKVSIDSGSDHPVGHINSQNFAPSYKIEKMIMADDVLAQQEQDLAYIDLMMRSMSENESRLSQSSFTPQSCTCNAATGLCPSHHERIHGQRLAEMSRHIANSDMDMTRYPLPPSPMNHYSHFTFNESAQQPLYLPYGSTHIEQPSQPPLITSNISEVSSSITSHMSSPRDRNLSLLTPANTPSKPSATKGGMKASTTSTAENTRRFGVVLEAMQTARFRDFDGMVLAYYTAQFEVGSFPAMAQCASRSRRMKAMLQELQERSSQWPRWESRGLHESFSEATASLCSEEMERLNKAQIHSHPFQSEAPNLITAFEWLLESSGQGNPSILEELRLSGKIEAAQDEMPYLWSLLTELAGSQGLYCDRIARIVMVVLLYARHIA